MFGIKRIVVCVTGFEVRDGIVGRRARCWEYVRRLRLIDSGLICGLRMLGCSDCGRALDADHSLSHRVARRGSGSAIDYPSHEVSCFRS